LFLWRVWLSSFSSAFISAAAVTIGLASIPAILAAFRIAHIASLVEFLLTSGERKCPLAIRTFNLFIFHLDLLG
jgi:hypothetical protein